MSWQRFPYRDQGGHDKRSGLRRSLVKSKRFCVETEICSVAIGFHGVVSRQGYTMSRQSVAKTKGPCVATQHFVS